MKGLLIKDYRLMKSQKQFFLMMLGICAIFLVTFENPLFIVSYMTVVFSIFAVSTISYDDYDNGMAFLFTLPITRRAYAASKYIFGFLLTVCTMAVSSLLVIAAYRIKGLPFDIGEFSGILCASFLIALLALAVSIPVQLKFGSEKSRIALLFSYGAIFLAGYLLISAAKMAGIDTETLLQKLLSVSPVILLAGVFLICAVIAYISYVISVGILSKKQF